MEDAPSADDRERRLIEAVVSLAKSFRDERDHLTRRLTQLEHELEALAIRLDAHERPRAAEPPGASPPAPSRTPS